MHGAANFLPFDQTGVLQYADMLQDCRKRNGKRSRQITCCLCSLLRKLDQDCAPRRIGERCECPVEPIGIKVNHMV